MNRVFKALAIAFTAVLALVSCKKEDQTKEVELTGIELNVATKVLEVGQDFQLTVTYKPENATTKPAATWASDTPAVATVDAGKVLALAAGNATITATVGKFTATCAVTVSAPGEEIVPVVGNSEWSLIGALLDASWDKDYVAAKDGDIYVVKNVLLTPDNQFKFRKDQKWDENRGAEGDVEPFVLTTGTAITAVQNGKNLSVSSDGVFDIYYNAELEQICVVAKDGTPTWNEVTPPEEGFTSPDWASVPAKTEGNHTFKFTKDDTYAYFYTERIRDARFDELWGNGVGYVYFAFDIDGDPNNGETLNSNGPFDYIAFIYCFGGDKDNPVIGINNEGGVAPASFSLDNIIAQGSVDEDGLTLEYRVPLADLPALPESFTVTTFGNKSLSKVVYKVPYEEDGPVEDNWDYTPSDKYLDDTNLWKPADGPDAVNWTLGEGLTQPEVTFDRSTYTFTLAEASDAIQSTQFRVVSNNITIDPAKKYNFYCKVYSSTGTSLWLKAHPDPNTHWPELFETNGYDAAADRILIEAGETKEIAIENVEASLYPEIVNKQCIMFDLSPHSAKNLIHIKDIIIEEVVVETGSSVSEIIATEDNTEIELKESLVVAKCVRGVVVTDGTKYVYAYDQSALAEVQIGDKVTMKGTKITYNGVPEISSPSDIVVMSSGNTVPAIEAKDITADVESYAATEAEYISLTGTLAKSGNYYNLNLDGTTTKVGSIVYPSPELNADSYDGEKITITGFFNGFSSGGKFVNIITTKIEKVAAFTGITIDGDMSDWASVVGVKTPDNICKEMKIHNDEDNFYFYLASAPGSRGSQLWGPSAGYYYLDFDWDNDPSTGSQAEGSRGTFEAYTYLYLFGGSADAPEIAENPSGTGSHGVANDGIVAKGVITDELIEIELSIPRANFSENPAAGQEIRVVSWRSKDGTVIEQIYTVK